MYNLEGLEVSDSFANEFETEFDRDGNVHMIFIVLRPNPLGGNTRVVVDRKQMPRMGFARSVNGGPMACLRDCTMRVKPLENQPVEAFFTA